MIYRSILNSLVTVHPGYALRALKNKLKLTVLIAREWPALKPFLQRLSTALGDGGVERLGVDCIGLVHWPYISKNWAADERLGAVASHFEVVASAFPALLLLGRDERLTLCDLGSYSSACSLVLDRPIWFKREGELVLNIFQDDLRVASIAFTLCVTDDELCLFIGAVQGIHKGVDSERSLTIYKELTKDFEGLRPRSFLIEVLKCMARNLGVARIYAVGDGYRHHRHPYFGVEKTQELAANYDVIWLENGATPSDRDDFFSFPLAASRRSAQDIAPKKRAMYRRRHALLDDVFARIEAVLPAADVDPRQRQLMMHRQRLGAALSQQQGDSATSTASTSRGAAFIRQLMSEPRLDQRLRAHVAKDGWYPTVEKAWHVLRRRGPGLLWNAPDATLNQLLLAAPSVAAIELFAADVLVISADATAPGLNSRAAQIGQMIEALGYRCRHVDWRDHQACRDALQLSSVVIFQRLPAVAQMGLLIEEAKRLNVTSYWDVDELIFDAPAYRQSNNLSDLSDAAIARVMTAVDRYRQAMLACDRGIAATPVLAAAMREAGVSQVSVIENAFDADLGKTLTAVDAAVERPGQDGILRIVYGVGRTSHDADFGQAAAAIRRVMDSRPHVHLRIIGDLALPEGFDGMAQRIEQLPLADHADYLSRLAEADICIAPLAPSVCNDALSNTAYLQAAAVLLPCVCSPRSAFSQVIVHGQNGLLADDPMGWQTSLLQLVDNPLLRESISRNARQTIVERYSPERILREQVSQVFAECSSKRPKRVLSANIFFAPRSFGGATVVAEQMARLLAATSPLQQFVFTSLPTTAAAPYSLFRYEAYKVAVLAMGLPESLSTCEDFANSATIAVFEAVLSSVAPDLVHLHSIQGLGAQLADSCRKAGIPYVVTLHDAWWICGRQFMINNHGKYCGQTTIRSEVCATCVADPALNDYRQQLLADTLNKATLLLAPSRFAKALYSENGIDGAKIRVNTNGILAPASGYQKQPSNILRFGYVGGNTPIKGVDLVLRAFKSLNRSDYELKVVDNLLHLGFHSFFRHNFKIPGKLSIIPGYTQANIDEFFSGIDVLLFPTQWKETFGLAVREALARDVWVISTAAGGTVEDIVDGVNGTVIPLSADEQYLRQALYDILENPQRFLHHRNMYKDKITFSSDQALELQGIYEEVLNEATPSSALASSPSSALDSLK